MEVELSSDWLVTQIEFLKALRGYEMEEVNDEVGSIDYVASGGHEKRLLRVIIDQEVNVSKVDMDKTRKTMAILEDEDYDEAVILAERFTSGAEKLIRGEESLNRISPRLEHPYSFSELIYAIQEKTWELCRSICGKVPETESACKGYQDGKYTCPVRRISDNADFHAERRWLWLMMNDFSKLVTLQREMNE